MAELAKQAVPVRQSCQSLKVNTSTYYRHIKSLSARNENPQRKPHPSRIPNDVRTKVRETLNSERLRDKSILQCYYILLDEGIWFCSLRSMYRIMKVFNEVKERRHIRKRPTYSPPVVQASQSNQLWSWDITKLRTPQKYTYFFLYVILDIYSRYAVGWMVATEETAEQAKLLIETTCQRQGIVPDQLTIHSDRGAPMRSKTVAQLFTDLGVMSSFSRPRVPDDNPYSEAHFKTLKFQPNYPKVFADIGQAKQWASTTLGRYNRDHYHSGIGFMTPETVHFGRAAERAEQRNATLQLAYQTHPERFRKPIALQPNLPEQVGINLDR